MTGLVVYAYSFFAILRKMAENSRMSKLSEKEDECVFSWKLFTGWDYMIGNAETAHNRIASIVMGFKEALLEEAEKKKQPRQWKVVGKRILVNIVITCLLTLSAYVVILVVERSKDRNQTSFWRQNETTIVMNLITFIFPTLFEVCGIFEGYHPRKQLRLQLARIMLLNLLNLYSLIVALFYGINDMTKELAEFKANITAIANKSLMRTTVSPVSDFDVGSCYNICHTPSFGQLLTASSLNAILLLLNATSNAVQDTVQPPTQESSIDINETISTVGSFYENTTVFTSTEYFNITDFIAYGNSTILENITLPFEDELPSPEMGFQELIEEFLSYLASNFSDNTTDFSFTNATTLQINTNFTNTIADLEFNATGLEFLREKIQTLSKTLNDSRQIENKTLYINELYEILQTISDSFPETMLTNCSLICPSPEFNISNLEEEPIIEELDYSKRSRLRNLCWETMFGQELVKLTIMDLIFTIAQTLGFDFFRGIFVRIMNNCWCWDLEKKFPQYADFKVAENILHLVNNQGMVWMGMFFSPGLVVMNLFKLYVLMYLRCWAVLTCNVPHEVIFRASRSNNFYYALLLMMLFLCVLPVGFAIVWVEPSWHCGPFSEYSRIFHIFTKTITSNLPPPLNVALAYIASPGIVIPLLVLLILIIYYLVSLTSALREANNDLKVQLRRERTEERRKMFQIAERRRVGSSGSGDMTNPTFAKWKKLLHELPSGKSLDDTPKQESQDAEPDVPQEKRQNTKNKDFFSKLIKRALGKPSEEDETQNQDTDTEQHDSLPEDTATAKEVCQQAPKPMKSPDFQAIVTGALAKKKIQPELDKKSSTDSSETKRVHIQESHNRHRSKPDARVTRSREDRHKKTHVHKPNGNSSSKDNSRDSNSSIWSENIPTITISKTESAECILEQDTPKKEDVSIPSCSGVKFSKSDRERPKIKYALRKQDAQIDTDSISYLGKNVAIVAPAPEDSVVSAPSEKSKPSERPCLQEIEQSSIATSASAETTKSVPSDTTKTESSSDYKDSTITSE